MKYIKGLTAMMVLLIVWIGAEFVAPPSAHASNVSRSPWTDVTPDSAALPLPLERFSAAMGYDQDTHQTILFGGRGYVPPYNNLNDTWSFDGARWMNVTPADPNLSPPKRRDSEMAYAGSGKGLLLFGGIDGASFFNDTWLWDGTKWNNLTPADTTANYPSARSEFGMVYIGSGKVLLFGGYGDNGQLNDTWIWDGTGWTDVTPADQADSPPPQNGMGIAYDEIRDKVVIFGGYAPSVDSSSVNNNTWTWDGLKWELQAPTTSPSIRIHTSMVYDPNRESVILFGGNITLNDILDDAWLWDGSNWTEVTMANSSDYPLARTLANMVYDTHKGSSLLFGGWGADDDLNDMWRYRTSALASVSFSEASNAADGITEWRVEFVTSRFGNMTGGMDTVSITAPAGPQFTTDANDYEINDIAALSASQTADNNITLTIPENIAANSTVTVLARGVTNPGIGSYAASDFAVATSQDIVWVPAHNGMTFFAPDYIELAAVPAVVNVGGVVTVTGTVYDVNAAPVKGVVVTLLSSAGSLSPSSVTSNVYGQFVTTLTAPPQAGTVTVTGEADSNTAVTGQVSIQVAAQSSGAKDISAYSFASLTPVVRGTIAGTNITLIVPHGTDITNLIATFAHASYSTVKVGTVTQISGTTANDFTSPVTYTVTAQDGTTKTYTVTVKRAVKGGDPSTPANNSSTPANNPLSEGKVTIPRNGSGIATWADEVTVSIPAGATDEEITVEIKKLMDPSGLVSDKERLVSQVYEMTTSLSKNFNKSVVITIRFDPGKIGSGQKPSVFYYDEEKKVWVEIGGHAEGNKVSVEVDHFAKFAIFAVDKETPVISEVTFADIQGHWAETSVREAAAKGIINGYPDGTFRPDQTITRAEFIVMLTKVLNLPETAAPINFTDKEKLGTWAERAVARAIQAELIQGYQDGTFRPNSSITRVEMAVILARVIDKFHPLHPAATTAFVFADDTAIPTWAKEAVAEVAQYDIMQGRGNNQFIPSDLATRAEAVIVVLKLMELSIP